MRPGKPQRFVEAMREPFWYRDDEVLSIATFLRLSRKENSS